MADQEQTDGLAELSETLSAMVSVVLREESVTAILDLLVSLAQSGIPAVHGASISLARTGHFETTNSSSQAVEELDKSQYETGGGPCVEATNTGEVQNLTIEEIAARWPEFAAKAADQGVGAVLSTPLRGIGGATGALNLYGVESYPFAEPERRTAAVFARHAAAVLANAADFARAEANNRNIVQALETRELIGRATGIVMERERCGTEQAFGILRRASQRSNRKLHEIAEEVLRSAEQGDRRPVDSPPG